MGKLRARKLSFVITNILYGEEIMANYAVVDLNWVPSPSTDLNVQRLVVEKYNPATSGWDGVGGIPWEHPPTANTWQINCSEKSDYRFSIESVDTAGLVSDTVSYSFSIGDLTNPEPASSLSHTVVNILPQ